MNTDNNKSYELEKSIWTETDFELMDWHDSQIYKMALAADLELDIDYIFKWNQPDIEGLPFTFWVAPATLVFKDVKVLSFDFDVLMADVFEIDYIERQIIENQITWLIATQRGHIEFFCRGFDQYIRQKPLLQFGQTIPFKERRGCSLERVQLSDNPYLSGKEYFTEQEKTFEHYENVKKRQLKRLEMKQLEFRRANDQISIKEYLLKKKEVNEMIDFYNYWLTGTQFENW
ncbi:MAG TPA: hypothetical protein VM802_17910 [Chitinophaga sp.]|uniref:hypothetical protein n=1 Tax=Chitinophaga sp. TaxID=1869181 RepID=UPI002C6E78FE|nr:hypothetical protein [Chitinophaga sp.]HVI46759.1 hypothetical protein [Chitinophaga sp.]